MLDTHTAVASCVYGKYLEETGDETAAVIASTASPYKFAVSVLKAIGRETDEEDLFAPVDSLAQICGIEIPMAVQELRSAPVLHDTVIGKEEMKETVCRSLGLA